MANNEINDLTQLIISELGKNREAVESLRRDVDSKLESIRVDIQKVHTTERELQDLKRWKDSVTETWSPRQMKEVKDEVYEQKNKWSRAIGALAILQLVIGAILAWVVKNK